MPKRHGTRNAGEALLAFLGLLVEPAIQLDASFPALYGRGRKASPGLPCKVSMNGVLLISTLELEGNSVEGINHPWISIRKSQVELVCQMLEMSVRSPACRQGGTLVWVGERPPCPIGGGGGGRFDDKRCVTAQAGKEGGAKLDGQLV
jgi:hypothetical protein